MADQTDPNQVPNSPWTQRVAGPTGTAVASLPTVQDRSVAGALVLTFFFGPLGLFYTSRWWVALLWCLVAVILVPLTLLLGVVLVWPISMIWGAVTASKRHSKYQLTVARQGMVR